MFDETKTRAFASIGATLLALAALAIVVVLFTANAPGPLAVPLGIVATLVCAFAVAKLVDVEAASPEAEAAKVRVGKELAVFVLALAAVQLALVLSVAGLVGSALAGALNTGAFVAATIAGFRLFDAVCKRASRPLARRPAFWGIVLQVLVTLPMLGAFGLTDPWETHYGEVAREMVARHDPLSPFWAHEGFFRTKPVLDFWIQALAFRATGVDCSPGNMLVGASGHVAHPEWAVRYPIFLLALFGNVALGRGVARSFGERAGFATQLVLATTAHFALLAHQSITDMPLVAAVSASFGAWLYARATPASATVRAKLVWIGPFGFVVSERRLVTTLFAALLVPQLALLASRNLDFSLHGPVFHMDRIVTGSAGNEALPGQVAAAVERVQFPRIWPIHQALFFSVVGLGVASFVGSLRKTRDLVIVAALVLAAIGTLAKGPAGFVVLGAVIVVTWLFEDRSGSLASAAPYGLGGVALAVLVVPWFLAMHLRHGRAFTDELVMRHMIGRTLEHLHDTNEGDDTSARYYLWQLGYGLFPWTGLVPAALSTWGRTEVSSEREKARFALVAWALVAFAMVTIMKTKFHHYVFPAVPPLAALVGIELDRVTSSSGAESETSTRDTRTVRGALALVGALLTFAVGADFFASASYPGHGQARLLHLFTYLYRRSWPEVLELRGALFGLTLVASLVTLAFALRRGRRLVPFAMGAVATAFTVFLLDVYLVRAAPHWGQRELVEKWVSLRGDSRAPLVAWQMNWKGESFYAGNRLAIFLNGRTSLSAHLAELRRTGARSTFAVCEHGRVAELGAEARRDTDGLWEVVTLTTAQENDKFVLLELRAHPRIADRSGGR